MCSSDLKSRVKVFMLSPAGRMSPFQRAQMYGLDEPNIFNLAVDGGKINTNIVGNRFTNVNTTAFTTGTAGGTGSAGVTLASDIYLTTSNTTAGLNNLTVKAVGMDNLRALNHDARVETFPPPNPTNTGTTSPLVPPPPPPNYDPSAIVPLPPP